MTEIKNKKLAILGTSPIMILLYFRLKEKNSIDVYENSNIGGAWRIAEINKLKYTTHNNVIVAMNKEEEKFINPINNELEKLGCTKIIPTGKYETLSGYNHKNRFIHDLSGLYERFKKDNSMIKKKVNNIKTFFNKVYLNGVEYDQVYLPCNFNIKKITINKTNINTSPLKSTSHHLTIIYNKIKVPDISYTENFDNVFDRAYFKKYSNNIIFTGRVRRKYKKLQPYKLVDASNLLKNRKRDIIKIKLNKYHHYIVNENILNNLKSKLDKTKINIVETRQFANSYRLLGKLKK